MKRLSLILIPLFVACSSGRPTDDFSDFDEEYYTPTYADGFAIYSNGEQLMLETYRPDTMRVVIPEGGFERIACMSSTYVGLLTAAGADDRIVAVSGRHFLNNQKVRSQAVEVGYEGAMDYESLAAADPDITLIYGVGGKSSLAAKLEELGLKYIYIGDYEEQDPLGRAEWMIALGALAGQDADNRFLEIIESYYPTFGNTLVMLNAPYGGAWFMPGKDNYMTRLIEDAGGRLAVPPSPGYESTPIDMEVAIPAVNKAQVWLNSGGVDVAHVDFHGEKWEQTRDFFESGAADPTGVINDLLDIFHGTAADSLRYFKRI